MQARILLSFLLSFIILFAWGYFFDSYDQTKIGNIAHVDSNNAEKSKESRDIKINNGGEQFADTNVSFAKTIAQPEEIITRGFKERRRIGFKNDNILGSIDLLGLKIDDLQLLKYKEKLGGDKCVRILSPIGTKSPYIVDIGWKIYNGQNKIQNKSARGENDSRLKKEDGVRNNSDANEAIRSKSRNKYDIALPNSKSLWKCEDCESDTANLRPMKFSWRNEDGVLFVVNLKVDSRYLMQISQEIYIPTKLMNGAKFAKYEGVEIVPYREMRRNTYIDNSKNLIIHEGVVMDVGNGFQEETFSDIMDNDNQISAQNTTIDFIGFSDKYWLTSFLKIEGEEDISNDANNESKDDKNFAKDDYNEKRASNEFGDKFETSKGDGYRSNNGGSAYIRYLNRCNMNFDASDSENNAESKSRNGSRIQANSDKGDAEITLLSSGALNDEMIASNLLKEFSIYSESPKTAIKKTQLSAAISGGIKYSVVDRTLFGLFVGPKSLNDVQYYADHYNLALFDRTIDFGILYFITKPIFLLLNYFHRICGNFGVAILLLTIMIKLILFPLSYASTISMSEMKKIQPDVEKLKRKYGTDSAGLQKALMKLYKDHHIQPALGCLPILFQIPVLFALYKVLSITIEMRHASFFGWLKDLSIPDPTSVFNLFGLIDWVPPYIFGHIGVMPILMSLTMYLQQKFASPYGKKEADKSDKEMDFMTAQMQALKYLPLIFLFVFCSFPSGLLLYWTCSNILSIIQQKVIEVFAAKRPKRYSGMRNNS